MRRRVHDDETDELIRVEDAEPVCGEDFCDKCGDCLGCSQGDDPCTVGATDAHAWVVYGHRVTPPAPK